MWSVPDVKHVSGTDLTFLVGSRGLEPRTNGFRFMLLYETRLIRPRQSFLLYLGSDQPNESIRQLAHLA